MKKTILIIGLCITLLLISSCIGYKTFGKNAVRCEQICLENDLQLEEAIKGDDVIICKCFKKIIIDDGVD